MKVKRILSFLLVVVIAVSLVGCTSNAVVHQRLMKITKHRIVQFILKEALPKHR